MIFFFKAQAAGLTEAPQMVRRNGASFRWSGTEEAPVRNGSEQECRSRWGLAQGLGSQGVNLGGVQRTGGSGRWRGFTGSRFGVGQVQFVLVATGPGAVEVECLWRTEVLGALSTLAGGQLGRRCQVRNLVGKRTLGAGSRHRMGRTSYASRRRRLAWRRVFHRRSSGTIRARLAGREAFKFNLNEPEGRREVNDNRH